MSKKRLLIVLCIVLLVAGAFYAAKTVEANMRFHPPQTEAEKALDAILALDKQGAGLMPFILKTAPRDFTKDEDFSRFFTPQLLESWSKSYQEQTGKFVGMSFLTCTQNAPKDYFYRTVKERGNTALIFFSGTEKSDSGVAAFPHRMIKEGDSWKLDGVRCLEDPHFNTDFNYTVK